MQFIYLNEVLPASIDRAASAFVPDKCC